MLNSKQYLKENGIRPRISFKDGSSHVVKLLKDKRDEILTEAEEVKKGVTYLVLEDNEEKTFFTTSANLIEKLSQYDEGEEVEIQMKRKQGLKGYISVYDVKRSKEEYSDLPHQHEDDYDNIPIIE